MLSRLCSGKKKPDRVQPLHQVIAQPVYLDPRGQPRPAEFQHLGRHLDPRRRHS
jgi:hypothetical protein